MAHKAAMIQQLKQQQLLPLFYHSDKDVCLGVANALYAAGIRMIEFTNRGEAALSNFKALVATRETNMPGMLLAVGTIGTAAAATAFIEAGVDCLISPFFDTGVCKVADTHNIAWIPGCMTPTEVHVAVTAGCTLVKLFPGDTLGPSFVSAIRPLFPDIDMMPTGGVEATAENLTAWFNTGVCAVGMGSKLISKKMMEEKNYVAIETATRSALNLIQSIKKSV